MSDQWLHSWFPVVGLMLQVIGVFAIDHMDARQAWLARYREDVETG